MHCVLLYNYTLKNSGSTQYHIQNNHKFSIHPTCFSQPGLSSGTLHSKNYLRFTFKKLFPLVS